MKNFVSMFVAFAMTMFVAISAQAQRVINTVNTRDAQACGTHLVSNPLDTLVNVFNIQEGSLRGKVTRSVVLKNNQLCAYNDTVWYQHKAKKAVVNKETGTVTVASTLKTPTGQVTPDTVVWKITSTDNISFATKESICRGETRAFDPDHKDYNGNFRHRPVATILGGGVVVDKHFSPTVTGRLGYETCHFLYELEGNLSFSQEYTNVATTEESDYISFSMQFNPGWKMWQDKRSRNYLAILGTVGYGFQRTDGDNTAARSKNYGLVYGAMLRGSVGITNNWRFVAEGGYKVVPLVRHNEDQDLSNGGFFFNAGVSYAF